MRHVSSRSGPCVGQPQGAVCPHCGVKDVIKRGKDEVEAERQRYQCKGCGKRFDDLTGTVFEGPSS